MAHGLHDHHCCIGGTWMYRSLLLLLNVWRKHSTAKGGAVHGYICCCSSNAASAHQLDQSAWNGLLVLCIPIPSGSHWQQSHVTKSPLFSSTHHSQPSSATAHYTIDIQGHMHVSPCVFRCPILSMSGCFHFSPGERWWVLHPLLLWTFHEQIRFRNRWTEKTAHISISDDCCCSWKL